MAWKAKRKDTRYIRVHNMLSQAGWYFKTVIEEKQKNNDEVGVTYNCMACTTMLAFTWEAYLNYFGDQLIGDYWKEQQPLNKKIDLVFQKLKIAPDWSCRPYQSISTLTRLRNTLAHGKPFEDHRDRVQGQRGQDVQPKGGSQRRLGKAMQARVYTESLRGPGGDFQTHVGSLRHQLDRNPDLGRWRCYV
jgi:hypothetical protein